MSAALGGFPPEGKAITYISLYKFTGDMQIKVPVNLVWMRGIPVFSRELALKYYLVFYIILYRLID